MARAGRVEAILGPTNTGKTHYAIERMLSHRTGVIGLPLRLLAREVYDRIKAIRGPSAVALLTGEERIVPDRAVYWVCTVEAMPEALGADVVAIDEIQLCADPERGHVFTDRLLRMRGTVETLFMGAETMRNAIAAQVPGVIFHHRERLSHLTHAGPKKMSRLPARSAIVGFSVENVYATAELLRRQKGGAAVVMGALSPRTRNAQVELYQNGEVDYLVATDAIGMGLNLDIRHVAFSGLRKFDGRRMRNLAPNELAQIAGRAGRHTEDGTFGTTGEARPIPEDQAEAIVSNRFVPVKKLQWRNPQLEFHNLERLIDSLEAQTDDPWLSRARESDDLVALKALADDPAVRARLAGRDAVKLLWDVCRIPDFRGISTAEHAGLLGAIFGFLNEAGQISEDWLGAHVDRIDRTDGDIDQISKRLAYIRTWTYVAQRKGWLADEMHWRERTRAVEDRLSDALHARLTQRFVDRRTSVLMRGLKQKESLLAEVSDAGEVTVEGQFIGRIDGFRFIQDAAATPDEAKAMRQAGLAALAPHFHLRADRLYNAPDTEMDVTNQGGLMWGDTAVGKLAAGPDYMRPQVVSFVDEEAGPDIAQKVSRRLQHFIDRRIAAQFEPLIGLRDDAALEGLARGFAFRMVEAKGVLPRDAVAGEVKSLDQGARASLRKHGIRFGQFTIFMPALLKPAPTRLRLTLWSLEQGFQTFPEAPPPGLVTVPTDTEAPDGYHAMSGYRAAGTRAIRLDMLERLADMLRAQDTRGGFEATADMLSITGMTLDQFADLMQGLGYTATRGERPKPKPVQAEVAPVPEAAPTEAVVSDASEALPAIDSAVQGAEIEDTAAPIGPAASDTADGAAAEPATAPDGEPVPVADSGQVAAAEIAQDRGSDEAPDTARDIASEGMADADGPVETEAFYTFAWVPRRKPARGGGGQGRGDTAGGKPQGGKPRGKKRPPKQDAPKTYAAKPQRKEKEVDPDNPFAAALMGLRGKS